MELTHASIDCSISLSKYGIYFCLKEVNVWCVSFLFMCSISNSHMRKLKLKGKRRQINDKMCFILCWNVYTVSAILGLHMCVDCGQATVLYTQQRTKHFSRFKWKIRYFEQQKEVIMSSSSKCYMQSGTQHMHVQ